MTGFDTRTVLVTGATGNVGRPLVDSLLAAGHRVRALTRDPSRAALPAGVEVIAGNLSDTAGLARAFDGADAAHLITFGEGYAPLTNGDEIAALALKSGVTKVSVLKGDVTRSPLEEAIEASGLRWTFLSPVEFMSNTLEWAESVRTESTIRAGFATARSAMIHDGDIAETAAVVLTRDGHDGREYWLTGPEVLTPPDQARIIGEALGREIRFVELSRDEVVAHWRAEGFGAEDIEFFLAMRTDPPEAGYTVLPTVEEVTGRPARTYRTWVTENLAAFS
ncbi:SDR family oxidoreductase [Actinoplanes aureus]|uniref:NmrA family NAD(P)-binding protein n=1 Tax=Actinoplanes aureus TaxID=2792083 RepID=A0A931FZ64_9ACTN|nr:NmrA family NAD(P)-binding protein [Actinoplanes aureus]MBG0562651.1 NmrA family NAD(P)-binding protein [Actinoplanes aureus]